MRNNQKGFSGILLLLIVLVIIGIGTYVYMMRGSLDYSALNKVKVVKNLIPDEKSSDFEELEEPTGTPEVINNDSVEEMDKLMDSVESTTEGEDFSDLTR